MSSSRVTDEMPQRWGFNLIVRTPRRSVNSPHLTIIREQPVPQVSAGAESA
jgi:hypothetical protein